MLVHHFRMSERGVSLPAANEEKVKSLRISQGASSRVSGLQSLVIHWSDAGGVFFCCDAAQPLDSSGLLERVGLEAILATCIAACVDAEALSHLVAQPITFCAGRRSSWSISARLSPWISASGAWNASRCHAVGACDALVFVASFIATRVSLL